MAKSERLTEIVPHPDYPREPAAATVRHLRGTYAYHLRTLTPRHSMGGANIDVDVYRLEDGSLVAAKWDGDALSEPVIDRSWPI